MSRESLCMELIEMAWEGEGGGPSQGPVRWSDRVGKLRVI